MALPIAAVVAVAVALVCSVVNIADSIDLTIRTMYGYQRSFAVVTPRNSLALQDDIRARIRSLPLVDRLIPVRPAFTAVKTVFGKIPFVVFGLDAGARTFLLRRCGVRLVRGRAPTDGAPEIAMSEEMVRNARLKLGDIVLAPDSEDSYAPVPARLVGVYAGPVWFASTSYDFVAESFAVAPEGCLVVAKDEMRQSNLDAQIASVIDRGRSRAWTYETLVRETSDALSSLYLILTVVVIVVTGSIAALVSLLTGIYFSQRLPEFATLYAIGVARRTLVLRGVAETGLLTAMGWMAGYALAVGILAAARSWVFEPRGLILNPYDLSSYRFAVPLLPMIMGAAWLGIDRRMRHMDAVTVIERR